MSSRNEWKLQNQLNDTETTLALALAVIGDLQAEVTGRRPNPERVVNGLFGFVKKRRLKKKAERAIAKAAVAKYREKKARGADKDDGAGWF